MAESKAERVNSAWDEIEQLVSNLNAKQLDDLAPPATEKQLQQLSRSIGLNLPPELSAHLLRHNGCVDGGSFLCFHFLSTEEIVKKTRAAETDFSQWQTENPQDRMSFVEGGWEECLIVVGTSGACRNLVLQMPDCETANPYLHMPQNYAMPLASDLATYLESIAFHLRRGKYLKENGVIEFDHWAEWALEKGPKKNSNLTFCRSK